MTARRDHEVLIGVPSKVVDLWYRSGPYAA